MSNNKKSHSPLFVSESTESAIVNIRSSMGISVDDSGDLFVNFITNRGKGSGSQSIAIDEFESVVELLGEYADNGIPEIVDEQLSATETIRRTISIEDDIVSFRVKSGKGAKPARIHIDEFKKVVDLLSSTVDTVKAKSNKLKS